MSRTIVSTDKAPGAVGPYSQAVKTDSLVFVSGQIAIDPATGELVTEDFKTEARQVLNNLKEIILASGSSLEKVVKATIFLTDMDNFAAVNEVYGEFFTDAPPARACVAVAGLPKGVNVEIEAIAMV